MFWSLISIWDDRASGIIGLASIRKESQTKNSKMCLVCQLRKFANLHLQMHPVLECKVRANDIKYEREESMCSANPEETFLHDKDIWNADSAWLCESQWPTRRRQGGAIVESLPGSRVAAKKGKNTETKFFLAKGTCHASLTWKEPLGLTGRQGLVRGQGERVPAANHHPPRQQPFYPTCSLTAPCPL